MQIKKPARDSRYTDPVTRYESDTFGPDSDSEMAEFAPARPPARREPAPRAASNDDGRVTRESGSESLIDQHSSFDGRYETDHDLRVEGTISGEVHCRGLLTIESEASARARIQAREAHIRGRVEGDIVCSGRLVLAASSVVVGTIKATVLVVEEGASLSGTVDTTQKAATESPRPAPATANAADPAPVREPAPASRVTRREVPSFAIVSSEDRVLAERH